MNYSLHTLTRIDECDALLKLINNRKTDLEFQRKIVGYALSKLEKTALECDLEVETLLKDIAAIDSEIAELPDGDIKIRAIKNQLKLTRKKTMYEQRKTIYGTVALLDKQMILARVDRQLVEVEDWIVAVEHAQIKLIT